MLFFGKLSCKSFTICHFSFRTLPSIQILVDAITNISLPSSPASSAFGSVRPTIGFFEWIKLPTIGHSGRFRGAVAGKVLQTLISGAQELEKKMREQQAQQQPTAGNVPT